MSKFQVGDMVQLVLDGIPAQLPPVTVLEVKRCDAPPCPYQDQEVFRFADPGGLGEDWMHTEEFEKVQ